MRPQETTSRNRAALASRSVRFAVSALSCPSGSPLSALIDAPSSVSPSTTPVSSGAAGGSIRKTAPSSGSAPGMHPS